MRISYKAFIMPHVGDLYSQCADRFALNPDKKCFAIADGVGNSLFPEIWADLVCKDFCDYPDTFVNENSDLVRENKLIAKWEECRDERVASLTEEEQFIYEMGLDKADFAACTFVGLTLSNSHWKCSARGDSFIFFLNEQCEIISKLASMDGEEFTNFPEYYASKKGKNYGKIVSLEGTYDNVSYIALMTDALSDWFIEANLDERKSLFAIKNHPEYYSFVRSRRSSGCLKDDDTTMVLLSLVQDDNNEISFEEEHVDLIDWLIDEEKRQIEELKAKDNANSLTTSDSLSSVSQPMETSDVDEHSIDDPTPVYSSEGNAPQMKFIVDGDKVKVESLQDEKNIWCEIIQLKDSLTEKFRELVSVKKKMTRSEKKELKNEINREANELKKLIR